MKTTFYINGYIDLGHHNFIQFTNKEIKASSSKQARFLLAKELHEGRLKYLERKGIYRALRNIRFTRDEYKVPKL